MLLLGTFSAHSDVLQRPVQQWRKLTEKRHEGDPFAQGDPLDESEEVHDSEEEPARREVIVRRAPREPFGAGKSRGAQTPLKKSHCNASFSVACGELGAYQRPELLHKTTLHRPAETQN